MKFVRRVGVSVALEARETMLAGKSSSNVRNLAYLALTENDQNSRRSRICRMRHVIVARGVSSVRVSSRRLVVPLSEHGF